MNTDTGKIQRYTETELGDALKSNPRLVEVSESLMTNRQRDRMAVSLHDTRSALGRQLHAARSRYQPHTGAKQKSKAVQPAQF